MQYNCRKNVLEYKNIVKFAGVVANTSGKPIGSQTAGLCSLALFDCVDGPLCLFHLYLMKSLSFYFLILGTVELLSWA